MIILIILCEIRTFRFEMTVRMMVFVSDAVIAFNYQQTWNETKAMDSLPRSNEMRTAFMRGQHFNTNKLKTETNHIYHTRWFCAVFNETHTPIITLMFCAQWGFNKLLLQAVISKVPYLNRSVAVVRQQMVHANGIKTGDQTTIACITIINMFSSLNLIVCITNKNNWLPIICITQTLAPAYLRIPYCFRPLRLVMNETFDYYYISPGRPPKKARSFARHAFVECKSVRVYCSIHINRKPEARHFVSIRIWIYNGMMWIYEQLVETTFFI